jgi:hypothetical protein
MAVAARLKLNKAGALAATDSSCGTMQSRAAWPPPTRWRANRHIERASEAARSLCASPVVNRGAFAIGYVQ